MPFGTLELTYRPPHRRQRESGTFFDVPLLLSMDDEFFIRNMLIIPNQIRKSPPRSDRGVISRKEDRRI